MKEEIKEIDNSDLMELLETTSKKDFYRLILDHELVVRLYNWITNLQNENERLNNKIKEQSLLLIEFQDMEQRLKKKDNIINELKRESYLGMIENTANNDYSKGLNTAYEYINNKVKELKGSDE